MASDADIEPSQPQSLSGLLKARLHQRQDSEHEQAIIRVVIVAILATYYFFLALGADFAPGGFMDGLYWALGYLVLSVIGVGCIVAWPGI